jgi:hypothetical protein
LDEIQARLDAHYEDVAYADDIAEGSDDLIPKDYERHYCAEDGKDWPCPDVTDYAQEDIRYLLAELRKAHEALTRVEALHVPVIEDGDPVGCALCDWAHPDGDNWPCNTRAAVAAANGDGRG